MTCCSVSVRSESFSSASASWEAITASSSSATVFDLPTWQQTWWQHFGSGSERILAVCSDEGTVDLLAPLMQEDGVVSFLGGTDLVDYHNFVCPGEPPTACIEAVIGELTADRGVSRLLFESVSDVSGTLEKLPPVMNACGWNVSVEQEDVSPRLDLSDSWDEYLAGLRKKDRHELRRKLRRLEAAGDVRHIELNAREDVETAMPDFFRLHRLSTPEKQEFMTSARERFFSDVSAALADTGVTRLSFLELNGERVATSLSFVVAGVRYLYNSGYNPEHRQLSVGLLNHAYTIRRSIEQGHSIFDFMRGDESYKYHLGGVDRGIFRVVATR